MTVGDLLSAAVEALARADAEELLRLAESAPQVEPAETPLAQREALARHRTLGRLLQLTRHNLRLLRGAYQDPCGYRAPRK